MLESSEIHNWQSIYMKSFQKITKLIPNLEGIVVGLNTNVDAIIQITPELLQKFIRELNISSLQLEEKIKQWKGMIDTFEDYLIGLSGCFLKGKASEWIIRNEEVYTELLERLPIQKNFRIGGQAGIMANILESQGVPKIFVHSITMPEKLKNLFTQSERIILPSLNEEKLVFHSPKSIPTKEEKLYLHIISEFDKDDKLFFEDGKCISCPRDNRFIATYDPLNAKMEISKGFIYGVKEIAKQSNGIIIAGYHMLDDTLIYPKTIEEKI
ncbi:MAG: ADP-dependent glucokinase/phosphofructokinase, partial [Candidatus Thorarchaeota archaeon]